MYHRDIIREGIDRVEYYKIYGQNWIGGVIAAETRGKARALFLSSNLNDYAYLEWTSPISIRLVAKGLNIPTSIDDNAACFSMIKKVKPIISLCKRKILGLNIVYI